MEMVNIFWFRRDLRLHDNAGLYHALKAGLPVVPVFIFDKIILDELEDKKDRRVSFIHRTLMEMQSALAIQGASLDITYGTPLEVFRQLLQRYTVSKVFTNHDYEPYATERDEAVKHLLHESGVPFFSFKDQVIFEKNEILKDDGTPYTVFTPYSKRWLAKLNNFYLKSYPDKEYYQNFLKQAARPLPRLEDIGFEAVAGNYPEPEFVASIIASYDKQRDIPGIAGTSRLGLHLRFGTVSIRELARLANRLNATYLKELIWREFYQMILWHFPRVGKGRAFRPEYELIPWKNDETEFAKWCNGTTGYPIVDAGMRELNATGFMHNRVRMITASFLSKHLLIDWRWGETYFAGKLMDFELASNNGGWQWAAGSGCDSAPYFRIFNPYIQTKKFDPDLRYIRKWIPELDDFSYPAPIIEHDLARKRCLDVYGKALKI
jgi:deoxyribodipyrimidine photo-lyase